MFFGDTVQDTRELFYTSWQKYRDNLLVTPLEQQLIDVIFDHPEYHALLEKDRENKSPSLVHPGETNPFLHMGLHLALREQIATGRPAGVIHHFQRLCQRGEATLSVEHKMMDCLAECLWQAQRSHQEPDSELYLLTLSRL